MKNQGKQCEGENRMSFMDLLFAHLLALCLPPKFCTRIKINIVFNFSWDDSCMSQTGTTNSRVCSMIDAGLRLCTQKNQRQAFK